ncbi:hypothetical protein J6524_09200 [Bradyrhizobium sp. WSM 1738]|uniref:hypothetical protein n=1 Tax=Bradyrhizobium hereditatis TaxID=2821405 RepID=UPI001CE394AF|nr:hypothetical protein [Bradyrhizobium hereditatis]MCA6115081.1 hypothetical protein [Bradyrhizobium hereditatis]
MSESAPPIAAVAQHGRGARGALRASLCGGPAQHRARVAAPEQAAVRCCPCAGPRRACGDVRGVCPILVLVNHLQKEHPA